MGVFDDLFLRHPREQGESYLQHARFAAALGARMVAGGAACLIHALLPFLFVTTGSRSIRHVTMRLAWRHAEQPGRRHALAVYELAPDPGAGI